MFYYASGVYQKASEINGFSKEFSEILGLSIVLWGSFN
jgi:hypothetical protein